MSDTLQEIRITSIAVPKHPETRLEVAVAESVIPAGFPSPTDDYRETFDIATHIVRHPSSTFFMRVAGDSMINAGIFDGDLIVVDRGLDPKSGDIIVAVLNGELTVKRFRKNGSQIELVAENPKFRKITIPREADFEVWGVVTGAYKAFK